MTKVKSKYKHHNEDVFFCDCADRGHLLAIDFDDLDSEFRYLSFSDEYIPYSWRDRLSRAWRLLRGKAIWPSEVILTGDNLEDLTKTLVRHLYVDTYGYDVTAHIERLKLAVAGYFNSLAGLVDKSTEEAVDMLSERCIELIDIFDQSTVKPIVKESGPVADAAGDKDS